jgi:hypothetical protein
VAIIQSKDYLDFIEYLRFEVCTKKKEKNVRGEVGERKVRRSR